MIVIVIVSVVVVVVWIGVLIIEARSAEEGRGAGGNVLTRGPEKRGRALVVVSCGQVEGGHVRAGNVSVGVDAVDLALILDRRVEKRQEEGGGMRRGQKRHRGGSLIKQSGSWGRKHAGEARSVFGRGCWRGNEGRRSNGRRRSKDRGRRGNGSRGPKRRGERRRRAGV